MNPLDVKTVPITCLFGRSRTLVQHQGRLDAQCAKTRVVRYQEERCSPIFLDVREGLSWKCSQRCLCIGKGGVKLVSVWAKQSLCKIVLGLSCCVAISYKNYYRGIRRYFWFRMLILVSRYFTVKCPCFQYHNISQLQLSSRGRLCNCHHLFQNGSTHVIFKISSDSQHLKGRQLKKVS